MLNYEENIMTDNPLSDARRDINGDLSGQRGDEGGHERGVVRRAEGTIGEVTTMIRMLRADNIRSALTIGVAR